MAVWTAEDRSMRIKPDEIVRTDWVDIDRCKLANRTPMAPEAVQVKHQRLVCLGEDAAWPPVVGQWDGSDFLVLDGRHEFLASLMRGRTQLFVAWREKRPRAPAVQAEPAAGGA